MNKREWKFQCKFVEWLRNEGVVVFSVPNGANTSKIEKINLIREGLMPGVADLIVMKGNGEIIFLELKTETGTQKPEQIKFEFICKEMGFKYIIVRPKMDFKNLLKGLK